MSDEYGSNLYSITDDEGNEYQLEHLDTIEFNDELYMAFVPADLNEDDPEYGMVLLKVAEENGEQFFVNLEEDEEEAVYEAFMQQLFDDEV